MNQIKSIENFKNNEILLNTEFIVGGANGTATGAGSRPSQRCESGLCWTHDLVNNEDGIDIYYNLNDCDVDPNM